MKDNRILITPDMKVSEFLKNYPELESKLIEIAPIFIKLQNPLLRKTIAKVTTLKQAAVVGGVSLGELITRLRKEVGQEESPDIESISTEIVAPDWMKTENIVVTYDAIEDLENGVHPVTQVIKDIEQLKENEIYLLITPFTPAPLIERVNQKNFNAFSKKLGENKIGTYISRK